MKHSIIYRRFSLYIFSILYFICAASAQTGLFDSDEVLPIKLKGSIRGLLNDRASKPKDFPMILSLNRDDTSQIQIPVAVKTRGNFRRMKENCEYPPLLIQFSKETPHQTSVFEEQRKLKLVMPCTGDNYVIYEWLVYKLYNLVTPNSFRARLVQVEMEDEKTSKKMGPFYGMFLEEEKQMAKRNKMIAVEKKLSPAQLQPDPFLIMTVFEYLIGNTDWSVQYLHNIKLLAKDSLSAPLAVAYDFDHAGIVNAPYAKPSEPLFMSSIRERRYRGYCVLDMKDFEPVIELYNNLKTEIYSLYANCALLDAKYKKSTAQFLDEFYETINNPKAWQKEFAYPCDKSGTGNVVIKGLKEE